jgi:predicted enzyme related to lactoylglutathione lyase
MRWRLPVVVVTRRSDGLVQPKAKKLRAKIMKGVTEVEGMGWLSVIVDPTGAVLGLWEPTDM